VKVLLVDDNANNLSLLEELLRLEGHEVVTAANGHAALTRMEQSRPDVVLCDLLMPGMSGEALLAFLAGDPRWKGVKPVVLTAASEMEIDRAREVHPGLRVLRKPCDADDLLRALAQVAEGGGT
jgi:CheY-like chemotaxis protein